MIVQECAKPGAGEGSPAITGHVHDLDNRVMNWCRAGVCISDLLGWESNPLGLGRFWKLPGGQRQGAVVQITCLGCPLHLSEPTVRSVQRNRDGTLWQRAHGLICCEEGCRRLSHPFKASSFGDVVS